MKFFPENISDIGLEIDKLFWLITGVVKIASIITLFLFLYPLLTRNKQRSKADMFLTGDTHKKRLWVYIGMFLLLAGDFYILFAEHPIWHKIEQTLPQPDFKVAIVGKQWMWSIIYPGPDGTLYTADDVMAINELHLPKGKVIHMDLKAMDVLHSVFLPQARFKQDVLPGRTITRWVKLNKTGKYDISCAEICGLGHSMMRGDLIVEDEDQWQKSMNKIYGNTK